MTESELKVKIAKLEKDVEAAERHAKRCEEHIERMIQNRAEEHRPIFEQIDGIKRKHNELAKRVDRAYWVAAAWGSAAAVLGWFLKTFKDG